MEWIGTWDPAYLKLPPSFQIHLPPGSRWQPQYSFLTSLSHTPLAFSLPWPPPSPRVQNAVRTFPGTDSSLATFSTPQRLLLPRLSPGHRFSPMLGASPQTGLLVAGEFSVSKALGSATLTFSCLVLNSRASPWPPSSHRCLYFFIIQTPGV